MKSEPKIIPAAPSRPHAGPSRAPRAQRLLGSKSVQCFLDMDEDQVLANVKSGGLPWAWDLRCPKARRRYLRVLSGCVDDVRNGRRQWTGTEDLASILDLLFPGHDDTVPAILLARIFSISSGHCCNLIRAGALKTRGRRPHCKATFPVAFASVERLLAERRIGR